MHKLTFENKKERKKAGSLKLVSFSALLLASIFLISFSSAAIGVNFLPQNLTIDNLTQITNNLIINGSTLYLNNLSDVNTTFSDLTDGDSLVWSASLSKWIADRVISRWDVSTSNGYLYNDTETLYFNDTLLDDTIDSKIAGAVFSSSNIYKIYFTHSKKNIIQYDLSDSDASIIGLRTEAGKKYIYGGSFE